MMRSLIAISALVTCSGAWAQNDIKTEWDCSPTATQFIGEAWQSEPVKGTYPSGPDVLLASKQGLNPVIFTSGKVHPNQIRKFEASVIRVRWGDDGYYYRDDMRNSRGGEINIHTCSEFSTGLECRDTDDGWPQNILFLNKKLGLYSFHSIGGYVGRREADAQMLDQEWMSVGTCEERNYQDEDES